MRAESDVAMVDVVGVVLGCDDDGDGSGGACECVSDKKQQRKNV